MAERPEAYRKTVLPGGIRVVTEALAHVRSVAVGIWVETGSRVEPVERGGRKRLQNEEIKRSLKQGRAAASHSVSCYRRSI